MRKLVYLILMLFPLLALSQKSIKWKGFALNNLDKQGRKQGEWWFFDRDGQPLMQCFFNHDQVTGARTFFTATGDTALVRFEPEADREPFIYYYRQQQLAGVFVVKNEKVTIELERIPEGFGANDLAELKDWYTRKIEPVYMFATQPLRDYFSAAYYKSNLIPSINHNFVITINASGKVTNVEWANRDEIAGNSERELFELFYAMGRWQPFFDTWNTSEIKITMSLAADLQPITAR